MNKKGTHFFARVVSENGDTSSGVVFSNASITINGERKVLLENPIEVSTGKTKNLEGKAGQAFISISSDDPNLSYIETSGTGRVEGLNGTFPNLALGTKRNRSASGKGLYATLRLLSEKEGKPEIEIQYFDLIVGKKSENSRTGSPHFGFRPSAASHFYVKTNELGAEHRSSGSLVFGNSQVIPSKILITCKHVNAEIIIRFRFEASSNSIIADSISIV